MIKKEFKFEAKISNGSKVVTFTKFKESHKIFKFQTQFDLEDKGQGHQFSKSSKTFR